MNTWQKIGQFFVTYKTGLAAMGRIKIWVPFLLYALLQLVLLAFVYLGVRPPFTDFFKGPLAFMVPGQFFHYPQHLLLTPSIFYRVLVPAGMFVESLFLAAATFMLIRYMGREKILGFGSSLREVKFGYGQFVFFWFISFAFLYGYQMIYEATLGGLWIGYAKRRLMLEMFNSGVTVLLNSLFAYATVVILTERTSLLGTIGASLRTFGRHFIATLFFVGISTALIYPLTYVMINAQSWIGRFNPEVMVAVVGANVLVQAIASFLLAAVITFWYLLHRQSA